MIEGSPLLAWLLHQQHSLSLSTMLKPGGHSSAQSRLRMKPCRALWFSKGLCAILIAGAEEAVKRVGQIAQKAIA